MTNKCPGDQVRETTYRIIADPEESTSRDREKAGHGVSLEERRTVRTVFRYPGKNRMDPLAEGENARRR